MNVTVLNKTEKPERLICSAGRGDMYAGYVGDTEYAELMEPVDYDENILEKVAAESNYLVEEDVHGSEKRRQAVITEAKTRSFIRKQASRGHWGIWEHPSITFSVEGMSRVTMAQITRHRHLSFDVQSMRYVDFDDPDYAMPESLTNPDHATRSEGVVWDQEDGDEKREGAKHLYEKALENCTTAYESMLALGVPPEDARYALPLATQVNVTMSGNARTMLHVLNLRQRGNAQWEIRNFSEQIVSELEEWIPHTAEWWEDKGPVQISP